ncbi:S66 family peptidase [Paenibacillus apiarius]|uniref:LD-carboxypeptidase n=1 Tax=Paenibacillus apiarius TaxID=46240 RepID=A0ABT4DML5_9BACL|nr:S66 peptidase family protein [Paenibacillus apiarius]MCY9514613.1 LD-carboxypeptidase [Paenibacillus apiarius]MCY9518603.1 LD-carboxypeptidase [Paenibacillus apiarius]MCY9552691.1 LD-carboxypeptidase [Paenibacillus apiarius]MCY9556981.1 LD-carboxypeptidase [Paenibacillus apiarius]MCY9686066.1 LD-carboxypeptidase [Paenibacillus apiarius]
MSIRKLKRGDEIRVIAPSRSLSIISVPQRELAKSRLEQMGFTVTYAAHAEETDDFCSSAIESRVEDLHEAFRNPNVKAILTVIGGYNSNQLLRYLDYELIGRNPKLFCGYSDITALSNAMYAKAGLVTYSGAHFSTFGMELGIEYTAEHFLKIMTTNEIITVIPSEQWSDDAWYLDQERREFIPNEGWTIIQAGACEGTIIGGNLCTLNLLQGTEYMPELRGAVLFLEDDEMSSPETFDRDLQSLLHQPGAEEARGLVIGRFQKSSRMTLDLLKKIIAAKQELQGIPVIANVDFGHTSPQFTFPIGGYAKLDANREVPLLQFREEPF